MKEITYVHFSDLHIGDQLAVPLLSNVKEELLSDLEFIKKELGHIDIVFMTGDLVQTGAEEEFSEFEEFFDSLMPVLSDKGKSPIVFFVPGNHDLSRTSEPTSSVHQVMKNWTTNPDLRNDYFWNKDSEYIRYCEERFKYFDRYLRKYNEKHNLSPKYGLLPGDTYHTLDIKGVKIGVVGLNSSFLQIEGGNYLGDDISNKEKIKRLRDEKYADFFDPNKVNIYLSTLFRVIIANYEQCFRNLIGEDSEIFTAKTKIIAVYGRADAHAKKIDENSFNLFRDAMTWLERIIDEN